MKFLVLLTLAATSRCSWALAEGSSKEIASKAGADANGYLRSNDQPVQRYARRAQMPQQLMEIDAEAAHFRSSLKAEEAKHDDEMNPGFRDAFESIAKNNIWHSSESISGTGSELRATNDVVKCLGNWIEKYDIKVMLDIPCGDGNWQKRIPGIENVQYFGFDISGTAVSRAQEKNSQMGNMKFAVLDVTSETPMKGDLVIMRDFLQHLPLEAGKSALKNAKAAGIRWVAVSTYPDSENVNVAGAGDMYWDNVQSSPFNLGSHVEDCQDYSPGTSTSESQIRAAKFRLFDLSKWEP